MKRGTKEDRKQEAIACLSGCLPDKAIIAEAKGQKEYQTTHRAL